MGYLDDVKDVHVEVLDGERVAARYVKQEIVPVPHQLVTLDLVLFLTLK